MPQSKICEKCRLEKEDVEIRGLAGYEMKIIDGKLIPGPYAIRYYGDQCTDCWESGFYKPKEDKDASA